MKSNAAVLALLATASLATGPGAESRAAPAAAPVTGSAPSTPSYVDVADLAVAAPVIARVRVRSVTPLDARVHPASWPGYTRVYVVADTVSLIRGDTGLASRISFIADAPPEAGPKPKWKKLEMLVFARPSARLDEVQLLGRRALMPATAPAEALTRGIAAELLAPDAPPAIIGVESAFHVRGTIAGESETQIFLNTASGRPVSVSIIRRPGLAPLFGVSLGEIVDEAAALPRRDTLLWYRLACSLGDNLPLAATAGLDPDDAMAARRDYAAFTRALDRCTRTPR